MLDQNHKLPTKLITQTAASQLYKIGIFIDLDYIINRSYIYNPYVIQAIQWLFVMKTIITFIVPDKWQVTFIICGSISYLMKTVKLFDIMVMLFTLVTGVNHIIFFYTYKLGIKPTFMNNFCKLLHNHCRQIRTYP